MRWTLIGTFGGMLISVCFNALIFADLGREAFERALLSAITLPILMGTPLIFFMNLRLRGMALSNVRLNLIARTDGLTSCLNRTAFVDKVESLLDRLAEEDGGGALLMIDVDHFKAINDRFGHHMGDEALTIIARSIRSVLRPGDVVGRMGGEEFGVFLPNVDMAAATSIAERVRREVGRVGFAPQGALHPLTISVGGAVFEGREDFTELFRIADQKLYAAKQNGRNRIEIMPETECAPMAFDARRVA